jgi:hypothetical protein
MKRLLLAGALLLSSFASALGQGSPGLVNGQVPTAAQWNSYFAAKQNVLGYTPLNIAGGVMTGRLTTAAPGVTTAGFGLTLGGTPGSPTDGDMWMTTAPGYFVRIGGVTYDVLHPTTACSICAVTNAANTFTGSPQLVQGATTTSPGWYAQVTGDANPRVRVGLNATDVASVAFGPGSAVRDTFIERAGAANLRHGAPDAASPVAQSISVQNVVAGTSNTAGAALSILGSQGTGTGAGGSILFKTAPAGGSGSSQNSLVTALSIFGTGGLNVGSPTGGDKGAGTINATGLYINGTALSAVGALTVGSSIITGGPGVLYNTTSGGTLAALAAVNNAVLSFNGSGVLQATTTLPSGLTAPSLTVTGSLTAAGLVTYANMASAAVASCAQYFAGTASTLTAAANVFCAETTTTFGSTTTFDFSTFVNTAVTLTGNITTQTLSNVTIGKSGHIRFIQDGTGNRTTVWNSIFKFASGVTPTLSTSAGAIDVLWYDCASATLCYASLGKDMR